MSIQKVSEAVQQALSRLDQGLLIKGDAAFSKSLALGQVLKGKVMRHYEGSTYSISFNGQEKVVDSAVPLKTGELIYGRVVGLDEHVRLQHLPGGTSDTTALNNVGNSLANSHQSLTANEQALQALFDKYQAKLPAHDRIAVAKQMNRSSNPGLMALSSLILSKLGLIQSPELLKGIVRNLEGEHFYNANKASLAPVITSESVMAPTTNKDSIDQLVNLFQASYDPERFSNEQDQEDYVEDNELMGAKDNKNNSSFQQDLDGRRDSNRSYYEWLIGRWILNMQNETSVSHRLTTFPIWFDDQLVEVSIAFFDQPEQPLSEKLRYRKLVFTITTDVLGTAELSVVAADRRLDIDVGTDNEYSAHYLADYLNELKGALEDYGWLVNRIKYGVSNDTHDNGVLQAVVEHHVTQDSLNHLI